MLQFKPSMLTLALVAAGASMSSYAAEEAKVETEGKVQEEKIEVIEVRGFRTSVIRSLNNKRFADTVSESISADDLGALPDQSIADALTRLPGVTAVRTGGQASGLNIRGLDGDFVFATLNGREQVTTGGKRAVEFDQYPSELISQAQVYKSQKASLIEGGVAGTVELKTADPLQSDKEHSFVVNVRGSYNDQAGDVADAEEFGNRLSFSYQGKYLEDTLGVAVGYAHLYQPYVASQFIGLRFNDDSRDVNGDGEAESISEGFEMQQKGGEDTRDGYMGAIHWQPNDNWSIKGDLFHSKFDSENFARGFRVKSLKNGNISNATVQNGSMTGGTVATDGTDNFAVFVVNDNDSKFSTLTSGAFNVTWNDGDALTIAADVSYSKADGEFVNGGTRAVIYDDIDNQIRASESVDYQLNGLNPADVSFDKSYTDTATLGLREVGMWPYDQQNDLIAYKLDFNYALDNNFISSVDFGVRYSQREFNAQRSQAGYGFEYGDNPANQPVLRLTDDMTDVVNFGGDLSNYPSFLKIDFDKAVDLVNQQLAATGQDPFTPTANWDNNWTMIQSGSVNEDVLAGYVQANLNLEIGDLPVTGNIGVRVVNTDQSSKGLQQVGFGLGEEIADEKGVISSDYVRHEVGKTYTDYLPSINLNFHLTDNDQIRIAAASVMARPPIDKLKSGMGSWYDDSATPGYKKYNAWGNTSPLLDPFYADQYDLSYEHYFEDSEGAIALAIFYKDIKSFINNFTIVPFDFEKAGFIVPDTIVDNGVEFPVVKDEGQYQTAVNNDNGGYIRGVELTYTQIFDFLPGAFSGLGFTGSYSFSDSEVEFETDLSGQSLSIPLPGLSEHVANTTLFYSLEGFDTRVSMRYRSEYVSEQVAVESQLAFFDAETIFDYQASYAMDNGLKLLLQVNNLTDEPNKTYFGQPQQTGTIQTFGRQYYLGFSYSM
ncbi:TonB-dependent receptor [Shewanella sp. Choline-02u-19]|uniref:TonB-dependent receptor n=1 Tax=unclassified Shewanella TaxID=196818 RepID=UPI000C31CE35|nr:MULTISPECIES: TonB-dependent receptor [unclassified Shewanella]PKH56828.1 TonB-dependent receptor [Shewanella sp. Bg11-22]PKI27624.1 TonB-dependent receptor [Shewanella sp. Choline-02u-19]